MRMPAPDDAVLQRRAEIVEGLREIVPGEGVIASEAERRVYESDGLTAYRQLPMVVVLPSRVEQVAAVLRYCKEAGVKVVPLTPVHAASDCAMTCSTSFNCPLGV